MPSTVKHSKIKYPLMLLTHWFLTSGILITHCDAQNTKCPL
jgi:hypothetical protein